MSIRLLFGLVNVPSNGTAVCMSHNIAYLRQVLQYFGRGIIIVVVTSQIIIGLRQFSHTIS